MGPYLFGDIALLLGLIIGATVALSRMLRGAESRLRRDLKAEIASVREEGALGRARLETKIDALRAELREVPVPGTGTDPA